MKTYRPASKRAAPPPPPGVVRTLPPRTLVELCSIKAFQEAYARLGDAGKAAAHCGYALAEEAR